MPCGYYVTYMIRECDMSTVTSQVRARALSKRNAFIRVADFAGIGTHAAIRQALSRLARDGELIPVREGLYWRGRRTRFGMIRPSTIQVTEAIVGKGGVGFSGVAAANALGLSSQVPGVLEIAVPVRAPQSLEHARFVSRAARAKRRVARLNALEVSLLETLDEWEELVEEPYSFAIELLGRLFVDSGLDAAKLARASGSESVKTRVRLKQLLGDIGYRSEADAIQDAALPSAHHAIAS